jgi:hypothetical protein
MGLRFSGASLGADPPAASRALRAAFADLALGFDSGLIRVSPHPEAPAGPGAGGVGGTLLQGAAPLALGAAGGRRRLLRPLMGPGRGAAPAGLGRRALRAAAAAAGAPAAWGDEAYAAFTGLSPSSVQMLTNALELNCGDVDVGGKLPGGGGTRVAREREKGKGPPGMCWSNQDGGRMPGHGWA